MVILNLVQNIIAATGFELLVGGHFGDLMYADTQAT